MTAPGYYPRPEGLRWWDGTQWVEPLSDAARTAKLREQIVLAARNGWRVEYEGPFEAVLAQARAPFPHAMHILITLVTCFLWLFVYLVMLGSHQSTPRRMTLRVDEYGHVTDTP